MRAPIAFRHLGVRDGFELVWFDPPTLRGGSTFVEDGAGHHIAYDITLAPDGATAAAAIRSLDRTYPRLDERRYDYVSHNDGFHAVLEYGDDGLIVSYPGIAARA